GPKGRGLLFVALLGLMFVAGVFVRYNTALGYPPAACGALALSGLPLLTMLPAAMLRAERLTARKTTGVLIAMTGVAAALVTGLSSAPPDAWRGDLIMVGGTACMALYNVWL